MARARVERRERSDPADLKGPGIIFVHRGWWTGFSPGSSLDCARSDHRWGRIRQGCWARCRDWRDWLIWCGEERSERCGCCNTAPATTRPGRLLSPALQQVVSKNYSRRVLGMQGSGRGAPAGMQRRGSLSKQRRSRHKRALSRDAEEVWAQT